MRHIIFGLSLLIALPQPVKTIEPRDITIITASAIFGFYLCDGVYRLAQEQKRKNDLLQESINAKLVVSPIDSITYFKILTQTTQTHTAALEKLIVLHKDDQVLQEHYRSMREEGIKIQQEVSDALHWAKQLNIKHREQFGLLQKYNATQKEFKEILIEIRKRKYQNVPANIIDKTTEKNILWEKEQPSVQTT